MSYPTPGPSDAPAFDQDKCPNCGAPLPLALGEGVRTCSYCGSSFEPTHPSPAFAPPPPPPPMWGNPYAGGYVPSHAIYSMPTQRKRWPLIVFMIFFLLMFVLPLVLMVSFNGSTVSIGVVPNPSVSPTSGTHPLWVTFTASPAGGTPPYTLYWDFGDGNQSTGNPVTHVYTYPGQFTVTVYADDVNGNQGSAIVTVDVN